MCSVEMYRHFPSKKKGRAEILWEALFGDRQE